MNKGHNRTSEIENYQMLTVLGKGGYAKVILVKHIETGKTYAMKILKKKYIGKNSKKNKENKLNTL